MPIYEFFCDDCNTVFQFFSTRVNVSKTPRCPRCEKILLKQVSTFSTIGKAKEPAEIGMADIDEYKMERALGELARQAENINEDDPRQMAHLMRKFSEKSGLYLGESMEEALCRLEAGDDPESIENEMGDMFEGDDLFSQLPHKEKKGLRRPEPEKDETLYPLE